MHPRAAIRKAIVKLLLEYAPLAALHEGRVFPSREEHFLEDELPALGVYVVSEKALDTSQLAPAPDERELDLNVEVLLKADNQLDDALDTFSELVEQALASIDSIGHALLGMNQPDTLLVLKYAGTELEFAENGSRLMGLLTINFSIEYRMPEPDAELPDFLRARVVWDLAEPDGNPELVDELNVRPSSP